MTEDKIKNSNNGGNKKTKPTIEGLLKVLGAVVIILGIVGTILLLNMADQFNMPDSLKIYYQILAGASFLSAIISGSFLLAIRKIILLLIEIIQTIKSS